MAARGLAPLAVAPAPGGHRLGPAHPEGGGQGVTGLGLEAHLLGHQGPGGQTAVAHSVPALLLQDVAAPPRLTQHAQRVEARPTAQRQGGGNGLTVSFCLLGKV